MVNLPLSNKHINSHLSIQGDPGRGKSVFTNAYIDNVEARGDVYVIWDPDREHTRKRRRIDRDWILDPTSAEVPWWNMGREYKDIAEAYHLSTCWIPDDPRIKDPFWNNSARQLQTLLCSMYHPSTIELAYWYRNSDIIDQKVIGTEFETIFRDNSSTMRGSILSHLQLLAQPLGMMPHIKGDRREFTIRDWCEHRNGNIFITSKPMTMQALKPLHEYFLSAIIMRLIAMGPRPDLPRVHIIFEEASSVTVQELHLGLVRLRKTKTPVLYALQNWADFKEPYGERAETIYSAPHYKVYFGMGSDVSAEKASATIGDKKIKRLRETVRRPYFGVGKSERTFQMDEQETRLVPPRVLQNLEPLHFLITSPGKITEGFLPIIDRPDMEPPLEDREIPSMYRDPAMDLAIAEIDSEFPAFFGQGVF